jgi:hypothetical protein
MKSLSETWFAEGYIDFELKKIHASRLPAAGE